MSQYGAFPLEQLSQQSAATSPELVVPLIGEQLDVSKRVEEIGTLRLHKRTEEHSQSIEVPLTSVQWHLEHVPMNLVVTEEPLIRHEGETTVYPVLEERVVIRRELVLIEEVRVTRQSVTRIESSTHILKREHIAEERIAPPSETDDADSRS